MTPRWHVKATYPNGEVAETDIEELTELHAWIERGSNFVGVQIEITYNLSKDRR